MEADFSGYATKAGLKCTDGRTIMPDAFKHQDKARVPLVWQHGHTDPENVLGHAILENRDDGVYAYGFFNKTTKATHSGQLLEHGDINMMSIWANQLIERSGNVIHGAIREVSLVLAGANPGAVIESVTIRHSDGDEQVLDDEAIIYTGLVLEHTDGEEEEEVEEEEEEEEEEEAVEAVAHADNGTSADETVQDIYDSLSPKQKDVVHYLIGEAVSAAELKQSDIADDGNTDPEGSKEMVHSNVFEQQGDAKKETVLSHDDMKGILENASRTGSLKHAVEEYALAHGITNISELFPTARAVSDTPEWIRRRTEWVSDFLGATRKSPFTRIKTLSADLTFDDARAKGYIKGSLKKEEFFGVASRTTTPTTIYKKQQLDRDDVLDISDFDVIAWLKAEMRLMLDEELARAILFGDGRDIADTDKINEQNIRPIAKDHELYTTVINVNVDDANSSVAEVVDAVIMNRHRYKGTGQPTFYTTEYWIARFLLLRDNDGRRMYKSLDELASELRVSNVVAVETMMDQPDMIGVMVNPVDYVLGADKGGQVTMFDDFDIDYNKQKYLIETRVSGALVKVKSAMVIMRTAAATVIVTATEPGFNANTGVITIPTVTGVTYKDGATTLTAGAQTALASGASKVITAVPSGAGYVLSTSDDDTWSFKRN